MAFIPPPPRGTVFVLLPAFNEEKALPPLLHDLWDSTDMIPAKIAVIIVDDGSTDATASFAEAGHRTLDVEVIRHGANRGLAAALNTGIDRVLARSTSDSDVLVGMDADYSHPPETIPKMVAAIWDGADVVIASRYQAGSQVRGVSRFRRILSWGARLTFRLLLPIPGIEDFTCGFRAYRVGVLREAWRRTGGRVITSRGFACTDELLFVLAMLTDKIREVPFTLRYDRKPGASKLKMWTTIRAQLRVIRQLRARRRQGLPDPPRDAAAGG
jgi:dolichol-phosphate mannosyltransferase